MPSALARRAHAAAAAVALLLGLAACHNDPSTGLEGRTPDGRVSMTMVQAAFLASGSGGSGTLSFRGRSFPFNVGGAGLGGIGGSTIQAVGEVYGLDSVAKFPGTYAQTRVGFAFGTSSAGQLWLQNANGVIMHLQAARTGLILSLGADAVVITMAQ